MSYLSTNEVAKLWGVSRKTVTRYASTGKIPGAMLVGRTWMIPEGIKMECLDASNGDSGADQANRASRADQPDSAKGFRFPMYLCSDFFNLKDSLESQEELQLYSAFEHLLVDDFEKARLIALQICDETEDVPIKVTCLYVMCRCCIYLGKYPLFMEYVGEMKRIFSEDFPYRKEMELLLVDVETYYKGLDSLLNFSFDSSYEYSKDVFPVITSMSLYRQILISIKEHFNFDPTVYELALRGIEGKGCVFLSILISSYLALAYHNMGRDHTAYQYVRKAYELSRRHRGYIMFTEINTIHPKLVRKALEHYGLTLGEDFKRHLKQHRESYIGLMVYLRAPTALISFTSDDYDYIYYAINEFTNKEVAAEKHVSESAVCKRYEKLCRSYAVKTKRELVSVFLSTLENYGNNGF